MNKAKQTIKKQLTFTEVEFDKLIKHQIDCFFSTFDLAFDKHEFPLEFAHDEDSKVNSELSSLHDSNPELTIAFFEVLGIKKKDKNLTFAKVIEDYCQNSNIDQKLLFEFTASIKALHQIRNRLNERLNGTDSEKNQKDNEAEKSEFTNARKVLALSYLLNKEFNNDIPDKTEIARLIDSLASKVPTKEIANSNIYKKVKDLFFNNENASIDDLLFIKEKFEALKMTRIVSEIETTLAKIKIKKR